MKNRKERYIIYVHQEYLDKLFMLNGACTQREKYKITEHIQHAVNRFLRGDDMDVKNLFCPSFTASNGELMKSIEIYKLSNGAKVKNLHELQKLMNNQKKKGFVELNKKTTTIKYHNK